MIALKPGSDAGQWRDSNDGLGGGRFPYDVNAVFVPAALEAAGRFLDSGLLDSYLGLALPMFSTIICIFVFKASFDAKMSSPRRY